MADSTAPDLAASNAGENSNPQPNANAAPQAEPRKVIRLRHPAALTKLQQKEVTLALALCEAGLKPEYAPGLSTNTVSAEFLNALKLDCLDVARKGQEAVCSTNEKEGFTADEVTTKDALMANLRTIQSAARTAYGDTNPEHVHDYLVGNNIAQSREALEANSQTIIDQGNTDRPTSEINTEFITDSTTKRSSYVTSKANQVAQVGAGKQQRLERKGKVESIAERRRKVQRAANTAWPHTNPANAKARTVFRLPENRTYSY